MQSKVRQQLSSCERNKIATLCYVQVRPGSVSIVDEVLDYAAGDCDPGQPCYKIKTAYFASNPREWYEVRVETIGTRMAVWVRGENSPYSWEETMRYEGPVIVTEEGWLRAETTRYTRLSMEKKSRDPYRMHVSDLKVYPYLCPDSAPEFSDETCPDVVISEVYPWNYPEGIDVPEGMFIDADNDGIGDERWYGPWVELWNRGEEEVDGANVTVTVTLEGTIFNVVVPETLNTGYSLLPFSTNTTASMFRSVKGAISCLSENPEVLNASAPTQILSEDLGDGISVSLLMNPEGLSSATISANPTPGMPSTTENLAPFSLSLVYFRLSPQSYLPERGGLIEPFTGRSVSLDELKTYSFPERWKNMMRTILRKDQEGIAFQTGANPNPIPVVGDDCVCDNVDINVYRDDMTSLPRDVDMPHLLDFESSDFLIEVRRANGERAQSFDAQGAFYAYFMEHLDRTTRSNPKTANRRHFIPILLSPYALSVRDGSDWTATNEAAYTEATNGRFLGIYADYSWMPSAILILHEVGHYMGIGHYSQPMRGLMPTEGESEPEDFLLMAKYATVSMQVRITPEDCAYFSGAWDRKCLETMHIPMEVEKPMWALDFGPCNGIR